MKRKLVQIITSIGINSYFKGFFEGNIYKGNLKKICVPGLNCYSCPGALGSCPIGSLQAIISDIKYKFSFYVVGFLMLIGGLLGRFICGWLCPFGLIEELLYKIPSPKFRVSKRFEKLKYLKYVILIVFVILLPMFWVNDIGMGSPTFCKYICPVGTIEGGIPLVILNESLRLAIGFLFVWKITLLIIIIILSIVIFRPFCRFICPLGAIYSLFNPISVYKLNIDLDKCTQCGICSQKCKLDIEVYKNPNSLECIRCGECIDSCPHNAIKSQFGFKE
ncbi:4Fe-4S binding domain-containing protein [Caminicella sporogenes DSM 14501]|uniref:4Fe-4S binding domain-containing protein n=1 Tax=Caminicella sporogenes DSM 14501 TaxID=1121266 RepID=A0A1M6NK10_9FIRM|nr:4Fe-4S binding protein [Caminicella sporogenes]RKD22267.1 4Fe-4S ferredoxin [Caminicella sporogenes]SHJ96020.1 4Fe-4S binding domain-containing protein [Caminicella sporogenes DSM 14501]